MRGSFSWPRLAGQSSGQAAPVPTDVYGGAPASEERRVWGPALRSARVGSPAGCRSRSATLRPRLAVDSLQSALQLPAVSCESSLTHSGNLAVCGAEGRLWHPGSHSALPCRGVPPALAPCYSCRPVCGGHSPTADCGRPCREQCPHLPCWVRLQVILSLPTQFSGSL